MKNNPWKKPELVIMTRSTPEEWILTTCKSNMTFLGADSGNNGCFTAPCTANCFGYSPS